MKKCNATLAKTQKGGEKLTEKRTAVLVVCFVGFHLNLTEHTTKILEKTVLLWTLQNQVLSLLLDRPIPITYLLKTATLL